VPSCEQCDGTGILIRSGRVLGPGERGNTAVMNGFQTARIELCPHVVGLLGRLTLLEEMLDRTVVGQDPATCQHVYLKQGYCMGCGRREPGLPNDGR